MSELVAELDVEKRPRSACCFSVPGRSPALRVDVISAAFHSYERFWERTAMVEGGNAVTKRDASGSANATVVALPRSAEKVDRELVERAVSHIRGELAKTVARGMDEVGRYLLQTFYDDDPELYFSASPNKHASLRLLIERCESMDFPVSRTFLANALRMAAVSKDLPRAATLR